MDLVDIKLDNENKVPTTVDYVEKNRQMNFM